MDLLLAAIAVLVGSGILAWSLQRWPHISTGISASGAVVAAILGMIPTSGVLFGNGQTLSFSGVWTVPFGHFALGLDPLAAWFLVPILIVPALSALFASDALCARQPIRRVGPSAFLLNQLTAAMIVLVLAQNGVLFLAAWEVAAVSAAFLTLFKHDSPAVQKSARHALLVGQLSLVFLSGLFALLAWQAEGSFEFADFSRITNLSLGASGVLFGLALLGFGYTSGLIPLYPFRSTVEAAAPCHVSAVLTGVYSTLGLYGMLRLLSLLGPPPAWWAGTLIVVGLYSAGWGTFLAFRQRDLKKLLACLGLQSQGMLYLGFGIGLLSWQQSQPQMLVIGLTGSLLHGWSHSLVLALLFLATGLVEIQTGTANLDQLGGQNKRLPWTTGAFLVGVVSCCGLPPFHGFASRFVISLSAFGRPESSLPHNPLNAIPGLMVLITLAFVSGLTVLVLLRAFGHAFLGLPRTFEAAAPAKKVGWRLRSPLLLLAIGCYAGGLLAARITEVLKSVVNASVHKTLATGDVDIPNAFETDGNPSLIDASGALNRGELATSVFALVVVLLITLRWILLVRRHSASIESWNFGTAKPPAVQLPLAASLDADQDSRRELTPKMQITRPPIMAVEALRLTFRRIASLPLEFPVLNMALTLIALLIWQWGWSP